MSAAARATLPRVHRLPRAPLPAFRARDDPAHRGARRRRHVPDDVLHPVRQPGDPLGGRLPFEAVAVCTALAAAITTLAMGLATNLPFALAPGLGINAVVAFDMILGRSLPWQVGMACVVIEGLVAWSWWSRGCGRRSWARFRFAEAVDRRRHRPVHHARRTARGWRRRQQPGDRHRPRRSHVRPGEITLVGILWRPCF